MAMAGSGKRRGVVDADAGGAEPKRPRPSIKSLITEYAALPLVRNVVVPFLAKRALLDHDRICETVPGVPVEVRVKVPAGGGLKDNCEVLRDEWGVPHVYAANDEDMFYLQGRCHVEDRWFQMETTRRLQSGTIAAFAGEKALSIDKFARAMGWRRLAAQEVAALEEGGEEEREVLQMVRSYVRGVNETIADLTSRGKVPWELSLLKIDVSAPWTPEDVLGIMHVLAFKLSFGFQGPIVKHALIQALGEGIASEWLVSNSIPEGCPPTVSGWHKNATEVIRKMAKQRHAVPELMRPGLGSNAWCIGPGHTAEGVGAILANDPHLDTGIPTFFYESHMCSKGLDGKSREQGLHCAGMSVPGIPGMVLPGHNDHVAWGVTLSMCDVEDVFVELCSSDERDYDARLGFAPFYLHTPEGGDEAIKAAMEVHEHEIEVKGWNDPVTYHSADTRHGPVISRLGHELQTAMDGATAAAASDAGDDSMNFEISYSARHLRADLYKNFVVFLGVLRSKSAVEVRQRFSQLVSPSLNICIADREGNIAYQTSGKVPRRSCRPGEETLPLEGWTWENEWLGDIEGDDLPWRVNPPEGRIVTANHKIIDPNTYTHHLGDLWQDGFRAKTIHDCLDRCGDQVTVRDCEDVQGSSESRSAGLEFVSHYRGVRFDDDAVSRAVREMCAWNGDLSVDSVGAAIYKSVFSYALKGIFDSILAKADLGEAEAEFFEESLRGHGFSSVLKAFNECKSILTGNTLRVLRKGEGTLAERDRRAILRKAAEEGVAFLERRFGADMAGWRWGRLHRLRLQHPLADRLGMADVLNLDFPHCGDSTTPNQATYDLSLGAGGEPCFDIVKSSGAVAACRLVMTPSDWDGSRSCVTCGQSGKWGSRHYTDQEPLFRGSRGKPMVFSRKRVEEACVNIYKFEI